MAGNYPDAPSNRINYHSNGSRLFSFVLTGYSWEPSMYVEQNAATREGYNSEDGVSRLQISGGQMMRWWLLFPEPYDLTAVGARIFFGSFQGGGWFWNWSNNTTNGSDGTWSTLANVSGADTALTWRNGINTITSAPLVGVTSIVFQGLAGGSGTIRNAIKNVHIYGRPTSASGDRLELWHPTLDQRISPAWFDLGVAVRNVTYDRQFRVKNVSTTKTANSITLSLAAPTNATPSSLAQASLSNGGTFDATQSIASLAPGAISGVHTYRYTTASNAQQGDFAVRIDAAAGTWV